MKIGPRALPDPSDPSGPSRTLQDSPGPSRTLPDTPGLSRTLPDSPGRSMLCMHALYPYGWTIKRIEDLWSHRAMFGSMHCTPMGRP